MAWFYNPILTLFSKLAWSLARGANTVRRPSPYTTCVFPKKFANLKKSRIAKTSKTAFFEWPAKFPDSAQN
jgi:hypothetical protein